MLLSIIAAVSEDQCRSSADGTILLPAIIAAASGLLGVFIGCFLGPWLATRWSKRNWQLGKAAEAYANLFPAGRKEIALLQHIELYHCFVPDYVNSIESANKRLGGKIDSLVFKHVEETWFFEKDTDLRNRLTNLRNGFDEYWNYAILEGIQSEADSVPDEKRNKQFEKTYEQRQKKIDEYSGPKGKQLLSQLDEIKNLVAKKYFH